jgi:hypothetical protein
MPQIRWNIEVEHVLTRLFERGRADPNRQDFAYIISVAQGDPTLALKKLLSTRDGGCGENNTNDQLLEGYRKTAALFFVKLAKEGTRRSK